MRLGNYGSNSSLGVSLGGSASWISMPQTKINGIVWKTTNLRWTYYFTLEDLTAGTYSHHPFRKENDLNQTSRIMIFKGCCFGKRFCLLMQTPINMVNQWKSFIIYPRFAIKNPWPFGQATKSIAWVVLLRWRWMIHIRWSYGPWESDVGVLN